MLIVLVVFNVGWVVLMVVSRRPAVSRYVGDWWKYCLFDPPSWRTIDKAIGS